MKDRCDSGLPNSVKDVLREFTVGYLLELCPVDVIDYGVEYFTRLQMTRGTPTQTVESLSSVALDIETMAQTAIPKTTILEESEVHAGRTTRLSCCPMSSQREEIFVARLSDSLLFRNLDVCEIKLAIKLMSRVILKKDDFVYKTREFDDKFYIIERGDLVVTTDDGLINRTLTSYDCIGELALLYNYPRHTTVQVKSQEAVLWMLCRKSFRQFMIDTARANLKIFEKHLKSVPIFQKLSVKECRRVVQAMSVMRFVAGQRIFAEGDVRRGIYFIVDGKVSLRMRETCAGDYILLATLEAGDYVGELSLITTSSQMVSAYAETDVKTVYLRLDAFNRLVGNGIDLIKRKINEWRPFHVTPGPELFL